MNKKYQKLALILLLPLIVLIGFLIWALNGRPVLFRQERMGLHKASFVIYKFRTMDKGSIYPFGKVLRKTGLDELPQLWNILKGEMVFVGPRPLTTEDVKRLGWDSHYYTKRWNAHPGLTGMAQLSPVCDKKMSWFFDKHYLENRSLILNTKLFFLSLLVPFLGKRSAKQLLLGK